MKHSFDYLGVELAAIESAINENHNNHDATRTITTINFS